MANNESTPANRRAEAAVILEGVIETIELLEQSVDDRQAKCVLQVIKRDVERVDELLVGGDS